MFNENFKNLRLLRGLTQQKVAEYLNISPQSISKWENGEALPSIDFLPLLAELFDCKIDDLFIEATSNPSDVEDIKDYFRITNNVYNNGGKHDDWIKFCKDVPNVLNEIDKLCNGVYDKKKINALFVQQMLHCSDEDAVNILKSMERCGLLKISTDNNFYKVVKDAVKGQIFLNKGIRMVIEEQ